ncbi:MAG: Uma2 family endonuclease [Xenococcaceae cyanobacterium]
MRDRNRIDLACDPPPDLVLEVEYSKSSVNKLRLYASMGVPEFWRYNGRELLVYRLESEQYVLVENSPTFGNIPVREIPRFLEQGKQIGEVAMTRAFRTWVREEWHAQ